MVLADLTVLLVLELVVFLARSRLLFGHLVQTLLGLLFLLLAQAVAQRLELDLRLALLQHLAVFQCALVLLKLNLKKMKMQLSTV